MPCRATLMAEFGLFRYVTFSDDSFGLAAYQHHSDVFQHNILQYAEADIVKLELCSKQSQIKEESEIICKPIKKNEKRKIFNKLLVVSFDGFRWNYDQDVDTPNLDYLVKEGVKAKHITPPFITMTSPSHFTTITGRWIEDHGVIHNVMFNPETQQRVPHKATQNRTEWWDNGVLPLWITAQNQGRKSASFHYPGGGVKYRGQPVYRTLVESFDHPDRNETEWRENIDIVMKWFTQENFDFITLYYGEPDQVGHEVGPETEERRVVVRQIDRTIGYLINAIKRYNLSDKLNVIITSDHGMTTVKKSPDVEEILISKYASYRKLIKFDMVDVGGLGMLLPKAGKEEELYQALKNAHPHLKVYKKAEFPERFHYAKHERILPILVYGDLGYNINGRFILYINKGDHGFDNEEMDMKTIFRAFGPDFKKNYLAEPFDSVHIYALMCKLLGINPEPNNGSLAYTEKMLKDNFDIEPEPDEPSRYPSIMHYTYSQGPEEQNESRKKQQPTTKL
ncbi:ectonucleotide pyrophosphatase/phosphodiesterase family member 7 [Latimeria chalumnae]|uniref:ectonucleotide pyrophosphatase/phosphodiesterase family member 7 n=1 Tax=Latimeria chalumnae TaxID=7897 RepID=UPI00313C54CF